MNREIKFRTWDLPDGYHRDGLYVSYFDVIECIGDADIREEYIGLKDKNGVDIFEGDICKLNIFTQELGENLGVYEGEKEMIVLIGISKHGIMVNDEPLYMYINCETHDMQEHIEIIGNIHENPDLMMDKHKIWDTNKLE